MLGPMSDASTDEDWRLRAQLPAGVTKGVFARLRGPELVRDAQHAVGADVVLTHDQDVLFGYARDLETLRHAQAALDDALRQDGVAATVTISHWEGDVGDWAQVEPPLDAAASAAHQRAVRDAHAPSTQTFVVNVGREIRDEFEQSIDAWAQKLGLSCELVELPHLLSTQAAFTVSGAAHAVEAFRLGLTAEERATIRTEAAVMASPL